MNQNITRRSLAFFAIVLFLAPAGLANCVGWVEGEVEMCDRNPSSSSNNPCTTIFGTLNVDARGVAFTSFGVCQEEVPGAPLECNASPGSASSIGAVAFNTGDCNAVVACVYDIWAIQTGGTGTGWGLGACANRDDSGKSCTDIGTTLDDFSPRGGTGAILTGPGKDEDPPGYAHVQFCARRDTVDAGGDFDDMFVFITSWADENVLLPNEDGGPENTGAGVGVGTFDIWVELVEEVSSQSDCAYSGDWDSDLP